MSKKFSEESYRHHTWCARATLFPDWSDEEVQQHIEESIKTMGFRDDKPKTEYVWVTYDPLYEKVVCVHRKAESKCKKCRRLMKQRIKDGSNPCYYPEAQKFKIKP
jgi:hypothetical protein